MKPCAIGGDSGIRGCRLQDLPCCKRGLKAGSPDLAQRELGGKTLIALRDATRFIFSEKDLQANDFKLG